MGRTVHKLPAEAESSVSVFGISSHENGYRVSWAINQALGMHFAASEDHIVTSKDGSTRPFPCYKYLHENGNTIYRLLSNRCDNGFMLEEYRTIDFIIVVENEESIVIQSLIPKIKSIPFISAIFSIDYNALKNKKRLL